MATITDFEQLDIWKKARVLQKEVFKLTRRPDFARDYRLVSQINDATDSVMSNVSEGIERDGNKELKQYLSNAKGSAGEVRSHLWVALDREYILKEEFEELRMKSVEIGRMIAGFVRYLRNTEIKGQKFKRS